MDAANLKYVVGKAVTDEPAVIRFFGPVDPYSTENFNQEFLWLQDVVKPSKIVVLINSEGGSVVYGMSTYSIIQSCPIDVDCVIEGLAASMGSVIWAAGKRLYMHDYSILMIHNPFTPGDDCDENAQAMTNAFRSQLETIYRKRFGMSKDDVQKIMDGDGNVDGTYLSAREAVARGILPPSNVIHTPKVVRDEIEAKINGVSDATSLRDIMAGLLPEDSDKLTEKVAAILEKNNDKTQKPNKMEKSENPMFGAVASLLGFSEDVQLSRVSDRIGELVKAETELRDTKAKYDALQIKYTGKETEVANMTEKLGEAEAKLKEYQDAEAKARQAAIENLVEGAVSDGRIKAEVKAQWIKMAEADFETVKNTLESIPTRDKLTDKIAGDPQNTEAAEKGKTDAELELEAKINAAIGKDFQFKKLED